MMTTTTPTDAATVYRAPDDDAATPVDAHPGMIARWRKRANERAASARDAFAAQVARAAQAEIDCHARADAHRKRLDRERALTEAAILNF